MPTVKKTLPVLNNSSNVCTKLIYMYVNFGTLEIRAPVSFLEQNLIRRYHNSIIWRLQTVVFFLS